ncbi:hypothetical protein P3S67_018646 [Capsicum chacoense]
MSNYEEALELLETSMNSCKQLPLPLIMFYDELAFTLKKKALHPAIVEWTSKYVGDFETKFCVTSMVGCLWSKRYIVGWKEIYG